MAGCAVGCYFTWATIPLLPLRASARCENRAHAGSTSRASASSIIAKGRNEGSLDEFARCLGDHGRARIRGRLHPRCEIRGVADRRVLDVSAPICDRSHDDLAGVCAYPNLQRRAPLGAQAIGVAADLFLHPDERALWMVLMRHRRPEQREDAVAGRPLLTDCRFSNGISRIQSRAGRLLRSAQRLDPRKPRLCGCAPGTGALIGGLGGGLAG